MKKQPKYSPPKSSSAPFAWVSKAKEDRQLFMTMIAVLKMSAKAKAQAANNFWDGK